MSRSQPKDDRRSGLGPPVGSSMRCAPLVEELTRGADLWSMFRIIAGLPRPLFFDSSLNHPQLGRYSFLTADPFAWLWSRGTHVELRGIDSPRTSDPFAALAHLLNRWRLDTVAGLPPFQGGAAGLFGYDLCHHLERLPPPRCDDFAVPDMAVGFYDWVLAFDHATQRGWLFSTGLPEDEGPRRRRRAEARLHQVLGWLGGSRAGWPVADKRGRDEPIAPCQQWPMPGLAQLTSNFDRATYLSAVRR
ncbi:MAG TPA: hypothetical protein VFA18_24665, partial [Gemmataceae bacterium]|nr:hypothetical protein [Gemmataceae bacterium]